MTIKTSSDIKKLKEFKKDIKEIWREVVEEAVERAFTKGWIDNKGLYLQGATERFYIIKFKDKTKKQKCPSQKNQTKRELA